MALRPSERVDRAPVPGRAETPRDASLPRTRCRTGSAGGATIPSATSDFGSAEWRRKPGLCESPSAFGLRVHPATRARRVRAARRRREHSRAPAGESDEERLVLRVKHATAVPNKSFAQEAPMLRRHFPYRSRSCFSRRVDPSTSVNRNLNGATRQLCQSCVQLDRATVAFRAARHTQGATPVQLHGLQTGPGRKRRATRPAPKSRVVTCASVSTPRRNVVRAALSQVGRPRGRRGPGPGRAAAPRCLRALAPRAGPGARQDPSSIVGVPNAFAGRAAASGLDTLSEGVEAPDTNREARRW